VNKGAHEALEAILAGDADEDEAEPIAAKAEPADKSADGTVH
jgi:hypothetical protein